MYFVTKYFIMKHFGIQKDKWNAIIMKFRWPKCIEIIPGIIYVINYNSVVLACNSIDLQFIQNVTKLFSYESLRYIEHTYEYATQIIHLEI